MAAETNFMIIYPSYGSWRTHLVFVVAITTFHPGMVSVKEAVSHNENPDRDCFLPKEAGKIFWETVASMTTAPSLQGGAKTV